MPLKIPDGAAGTHFVIALAIVAGFSERWARGVLAGTEERIQGAGSTPRENQLSALEVQQRELGREDVPTALR